MVEKDRYANQCMDQRAQKYTTEHGETIFTKVEKPCSWKRVMPRRDVQLQKDETELLASATCKINPGRIRVEQLSAALFLSFL